MMTTAMTIDAMTERTTTMIMAVTKTTMRQMTMVMIDVHEMMTMEVD